MVLFINTAIPNKIFIALLKEKSNLFFRKEEIRVQFNQSEKLLLLIDELLRKSKTLPSDLSGIIVVSGPGSFTALRIGVTVANTFGFVLKIPAAGINLGEFKDEKALIKKGAEKLAGARVGETIKPFYGQEPKISKPRINLTPVAYR